MYYLIEKIEQLNRLKAFEDCFVSFIPFNDNFHPKLNSVSLIYIRGLSAHKGYMFCIKHSESLSLELGTVLEFLKHKTNKIFVINKKESLYYFNENNKLFDISFIQKPDLSSINNECISYFYKKFYNYKETNCLIPIAKHYEEQEHIFQIIKPIIKKYDENDPIYKFKNTTLINSFFSIENQGIKLNKELFIKHYQDKIPNPEFNIEWGKIYTQYNLYTLTGRPSNNYNGINFVALNKENGERKCFIPENDEFIEFDINAYHPRIIGELIDYELPQEKLYEVLGIEKEEMFQNIYGGVRKNHPFLLKVKEYIEKHWGKGHEAQKQFNYKIQNTETFNNTFKIQGILHYLKNKQSKLVHYVYDSFLIDYSKKDGNIIDEIQKIIKYPTKIKTGKDYHGLK